MLKGALVIIWLCVLSKGGRPGSVDRLPPAKSAFCRTESDTTRYHPLSPPEFHIPWVWEAVYDTSTSYVDITTLPQLACEFNKTLWHRMIQLHPEYSHQLSDGENSNILVDIKVGKDKFNYVKSMVGAQFTCVFYHKSGITHRIQSLPVNFKTAFAGMSSTQIHCPVPKPGVMWDSMHIERDLAQLSRFTKSAVQFGTNATEVFPVCLAPHTHGNHHRDTGDTADTAAQRSSREYKYELAVCTATQRTSRAKLVEWIEYHLLQGVDHFYMYNTIFPVERQHELADMLTDYIQQGIVTLVPWPYANCVQGMSASGRSISFIDADNVNAYALNDFDRHRFAFHPPNRITQSSALASCYTRYRHTTRYMAHIDDDEFFKVALPTSKARPEQARNTKPLLQYVDAMFAKFPAAPALKFSPVMMSTCSVPPGFDTTTHFDALPRLGKHPFGKMGLLGDGKMIMRTDAVDMFFVHYLTALAKGVKQRQSLMSHPRRAVLLHYKTSAHLSGDDITGRFIPLNITFEAIVECNNTHFLPLDRPPSDKLAVQQRVYSLHRDKQQRQLIYETFCQSTLVSCPQHLTDSDDCRIARKACEESAEWNTEVLSEKEDFTSHYFEKQFIEELQHNVRSRLVY